MTDSYGRALEVGNLVAFADRAKARIALVTGFTETMVRLSARKDGSSHLRSPWSVTLLDDPTPPEHSWIRDSEGLLYCELCRLPYACWAGDPCCEDV